MKWTYKVKKFLLDIILPNTCPICNDFIGYDEYICEKCLSNLPLVEENICNRCKRKECICTDLFYDNCISFVYYEDSVKDGLLSFKLKGLFNFAEYFAQKAVEMLKENGILDEIDLITNVPMTAQKEYERGYDQAFEFAKMISMFSGLPLDGMVLVKEKGNVVQHELSSKERKEKAYEAFELNIHPKHIKGKTILLCDDVVTTGSTLDACAKLLKEAGVKKVYCVTIATTRFVNNDSSRNA